LSETSLFEFEQKEKEFKENKFFFKHKH
jgi:hypothetical protein